MKKSTTLESFEMQNFRVVMKREPGSPEEVRILHDTFNQLSKTEPGSERWQNAKNDWQNALKSLALADAEGTATEERTHERIQSMLPAEKALFVIERDKARLAKDKQVEAERRAHAEKIKSTLAKLESTKAAMLAKPDHFSDYDLFVVEKAIAQVREVNGCPAAAAQFSQDVDTLVAKHKQVRGEAIASSLAEIESKRVALLKEQSEITGQPAEERVSWDADLEASTWSTYQELKGRLGDAAPETKAALESWGQYRDVQPADATASV